MRARRPPHRNSSCPYMFSPLAAVIPRMGQGRMVMQRAASVAGPSGGPRRGEGQAQAPARDCRYSRRGPLLPGSGMTANTLAPGNARSGGDPPFAAASLFGRAGEGGLGCGLRRGVEPGPEVGWSARTNVRLTVPAGHARGPALPGVVGADAVRLAVRRGHVAGASAVATAILESVVALAALHVLMTSAASGIFLNPL
jgi:hypothetical protein